MAMSATAAAPATASNQIGSTAFCTSVPAGLCSPSAAVLAVTVNGWGVGWPNQCSRRGRTPRSTTLVSPGSTANSSSWRRNDSASLGSVASSVSRCGALPSFTTVTRCCARRAVSDRCGVSATPISSNVPTSNDADSAADASALTVETVETWNWCGPGAVSNFRAGWSRIADRCFGPGHERDDVRLHGDPVGVGSRSPRFRTVRPRCRR